MSWLSQLAYCPRRAGLLLNERLWAESTDTAKGRAEHTRVHTQRVEKRGNLVNLYEFTVFSDSLLLLGKCDCVEARRDDSFIPLSISMAHCERKKHIRSSFARRQCAWRKCSIL